MKQGCDFVTAKCLSFKECTGNTLDIRSMFFYKLHCFALQPLESLRVIGIIDTTHTEVVAQKFPRLLMVSPATVPGLGLEAVRSSTEQRLGGESS